MSAALGATYGSLNLCQICTRYICRTSIVLRTANLKARALWLPEKNGERFTRWQASKAGFTPLLLQT